MAREPETIVVKKKGRKRGEEHCWGCGREDVHKDDIVVEHGPFAMCRKCVVDPVKVKVAQVKLRELETPYKDLDPDVSVETLKLREYVDRNESLFKLALDELLIGLKKKKK